MQQLLIFVISISVILMLQIVNLRINREVFQLKKEDPRFKKMVTFIYLNFGIYLILLYFLAKNLLER